MVPEWPRISGFMRKSSRRADAPSMRFSVLLNSFDNFFVTFPQFPQKLELRSFLRSGNIRVLCQVAPRMILTVFLI